ncbi:MAG TPA: LysM peptidoglycan-binding domain-containing protein, partial [Anaeromyxobacteraceae bacterium]|nr:LysM peptidoglycan-binding domain-containing protein [Anaeromyxobacteraceae bacterium]
TLVPIVLLSFLGAGPAAGAASSASAAALNAAPGPADLPAAAGAPLPAGARGLPLPRSLLEEAAPGGDQGDEEAIEEEIEAQSAEMEAMRSAEEKAALTPERPGDGAARAAARLGLESPLRQRLDEALAGDLAPAPEEDQGRIALFPEIDHDLRRLQAEYDIPVEVNEAVLAYVRFFQTEPARGHFVRWLGRYHKYQERYRRILAEHGLPEDTVFLAMIESGFANLAYSRARASGPWQFIAATGRRMGLKQDFWVDERRDPEKAARAASRYLKELHEQTGDWRLAWAGYNAGVNRILRAQRTGQADFWAMTRGRVIRKETKGYVPKLMAAAIVTKHQEAFGFRPEEVTPGRWDDYEEVTVPHATDLSALARAAGLAEKELLELNPELRRSCTPPRPYALKIPKGRAEAFSAAWPSVESSGRLAFANHRVQRGESLVAVAAGYGVPPDAIARMNGLRPGRRLRAGTELVVPVSAQARRNGGSANEAVARTRIQEYQLANPASVEHEPPPRAALARLEQVDGRTRATVLVQSGDSLWAIAQKFGVGLDELCRWNGIANPRRLKLQVGRELVVYPKVLPPTEGAARQSGPG